MPQILDHFFSLAYREICLSDQEVELPWNGVPDSLGILADKTSITVHVTDDESGGTVEVEVYLGTDETPPLRDLRSIFDGPLHLTNPGLLIFEPTGEEVTIQDIREGLHHIAIYSNGYPASRLVVLIDGQARSRN
jgi:hypothetical protein